MIILLHIDIAHFNETRLYFQKQKNSRKNGIVSLFFQISLLFGLMENRWRLICCHSQYVGSVFWLK